MWVVKLGGSLTLDGALPDWLELLATLGRGRVVLVPGGGAFADAARATQARWTLDDVAGHNMAVLGMAQTAAAWRGLQPALRAATRAEDLPRLVHQGHATVWMPLDLLRDGPDDLTTWDVSSDSLALWLAGRLHAERLVVVKSCPVDPCWSLAEMAGRGVVDRQFPIWAADADCPIDVVSSSALTAMRALLQSSGACAVHPGARVRQMQG